MTKRISPEDAKLLSENITQLIHGHGQQIDSMIVSLKVVKAVEGELAKGCTIEQACENASISLRKQGITLNAVAIHRRYYRMLRTSV